MLVRRKPRRQQRASFRTQEDGAVRLPPATALDARAFVFRAELKGGPRGTDRAETYLQPSRTTALAS